MAGPFLIGKRVQLRAYEEEDATILAKWINDPEVRLYLNARFPNSIKDEKEWIAALSESKGTPRNIVLGVELKRGRRLIGSVGLHMIDWVQRRAMTGSLIGPKAMRGRGYGTEAKNLLLDYAFGDLGMMSIWSFVVAGNEPSVRALKKQGYRQGGLFRRSAWFQGEWRDNLYFDIVREDWEGLPRRKGKRARRS